MKNLIIISFFLICIQFCFAQSTPLTEEEKNIKIFKEMFSEFAEKRDMSKIDHYYSNDFLLDSNHKIYDYPVYKKQQTDIFKTLKNLKVINYDDLFAKNDKVVSRMTIELTNKDSKVDTYYVILIAQLKNNKIYRIWEVTYPSWSEKLPIGN